MAVQLSGLMLTSPIDFFFFFIPTTTSRPTASSFLAFFSLKKKKWTTCSTVLLVLISEPHTRAIICWILSYVDQLKSISTLRCVGVWQNDRVEIIANDRTFIFHGVLFFTNSKSDS